MDSKYNFNQSIALTSGNQVTQILQATNLTSYGIKDFAYVKIYSDNSRIILSTRPDWIEVYLNHYFDKGMTSKSIDYYQSDYLLWNALSEQEICKIMREHFNMAHGITLNFKQNKTCELNLFSTYQDNYDIANFYINNIDILKSFVFYFREKAKKLIDKAACYDRAILPKSLPIYSHTSSSLQKKHKLNVIINRYYLDSSIDGLYVTDCEFKIISFMVKGLTAKAIAKHLKISNKTVEAHISHVKSRLSIHSKQALFDSMLHYGLIKVN